MNNCIEVAGITNQGYHVEPAEYEWKTQKCGPEELRENYRAAMIDAAIDERLKRERRRRV